MTPPRQEDHPPAMRHVCGCYRDSSFYRHCIRCHTSFSSMDVEAQHECKPKPRCDFTVTLRADDPFCVATLRCMGPRHHFDSGHTFLLPKSELSYVGNEPAERDYVLRWELDP